MLVRHPAVSSCQRSFSSDGGWWLMVASKIKVSDIYEWTQKNILNLTPTPKIAQKLGKNEQSELNGG